MVRILCPLALGAVLAGCGGDDEAPEPAPAVPDEAEPAEVGAGGGLLIALEEQEGSGVSGRAELIGEDGDTTIVVELDDPEAFHVTAYLQEGDCTEVNAESAEVLALFLDGRSETIVDEELSTLQEGSFVIAVHEDERPELQRPAACGEIREEES